MHDEDCAIGLQVKNRACDSWACYGDKRALDEVAADNLKRCVAAVQASADEIYTAYVGKTIPSPSNYKAWTIAPTLESALGTQDLAPLFKYKDASQTDVERRKVIENRRIDIKFHSNDRDGTKFINQVGLFGDLVAVQLSSTYGALFVSSIRVYNWKTSEEVSVLPSLLLQGKRLLMHACLLVATGSFLTLLS